MANVERLEHVMQVVEEAANADLWEQNDWIAPAGTDTAFDFDGVHYCGTAGCFAGWAAMQDGWKSAYSLRTELGLHWGKLWPIKVDGLELYGTDLIKDGLVMATHEIARWAEGYFDLAPGDCDVLFKGDNSLEDLRGYVKRLANGESIALYDDEEEDDD